MKTETLLAFIVNFQSTKTKKEERRTVKHSNKPIDVTFRFMNTSFFTSTLLHNAWYEMEGKTMVSELKWGGHVDATSISRSHSYLISRWT